jgi:hypothetical protein
MELLALHGDMGADGGCRRLAVARLERRDDGLVFAHGLAQPSAQAQLHAPERLQPLVQAQAFLFEKPVAGLAVEDRVKAFVLAVIGVRVRA